MRQELKRLVTCFMTASEKVDSSVRENGNGSLRVYTLEGCRTEKLCRRNWLWKKLDRPFTQVVTRFKYCQCSARFVCLAFGLVGILVAYPSSAISQPGSLEREVAIGDSLVSRSLFEPGVARLSSAAAKLEQSSQRSLYVRCLSLLADGLSREEKIREADSVASLAEQVGLRELGPDNPELGTIYGTLSIIRSVQERFDDGLEYARRCLANRIKNRGANDPYVGAAYYALGASLQLAGSYAQALVCLDSAELLQRRAFGPEHIDVACTQSVKGDVLAKMGRTAEAMTVTQEALHTLGHLDQLNTPIADCCYFNMREICEQSGLLDEAAEWGKKTLDVRRKLYQPDAPNIAVVLDRLGDDYFWLGDFEAARLYYEQSIAVYRKTLDAHHSSVLTVQRRLANLYAEKGDVQRALELAIPAVQQQVRALGEMHPRLEVEYEGLAEIFVKAHQWDSAKTYYRKALLLTSSPDVKRYRRDAALVFQRLGDAWCEMGETDSAAACLRESLETQDSSDASSPTLRCETFASMSKLEERRGNLAGALAMCQKALASLSPDFSDTAGNPPPPGGGYDAYYLKVLTQKAHMLEKEYSLSSQQAVLGRALESYALACDALDRMMSQCSSERSRLLLQSNGYPLYENGLLVSERLFTSTRDPRYRESAFRFAERSKAGVLRESMEETRALHYAGIPDSTVKREDRLSRNLTAMITRAQWIEERNDAGLRESTRKQILDTGEELERLQAEIRRQYPGYAKLRMSNSQPSLAAVQERLAEGECLLEYCVGEGTLHLLIVERDSIGLSSTTFTVNLEEEVRRLLHAIRTMDKSAYLRLASRLSSLLLKPAAAALGRNEKLVIVPDGILHYLPFEVLLTARISGARPVSPDCTALPYLVRTHSVSYALSATLFAESRGDGHAPAKLPLSFTGFAPVFGDSSSRYSRPVAAFASREALRDARSITLDGRTFHALPYSEQEVKTIMAEFRERGEKSTGFFRSQATKEKFLANAASSSILHIATHGYVNERRPEISALLFYPSGKASSPEDAVLYAGETYNLRLNADLVVLSSCESGIGRLVRGEGLLAMTRGFFYAGARNLLFSLWKVSDRNADELMSGFYRNVLAGTSYPAALRRAKLDLIRNSATAFPLKWAGFVMMGE